MIQLQTFTFNADVDTRLETQLLFITSLHTKDDYLTVIKCGANLIPGSQTDSLGMRLSVILTRPLQYDPVTLMLITECSFGNAAIAE